jgi:hypothetical protein
LPSGMYRCDLWLMHNPSSSRGLARRSFVGWQWWLLSAFTLSRFLSLNYLSLPCSNADNPFAGQYILSTRHCHRILPMSIVYVCRIASFASVNLPTRFSTALSFQTHQYLPRWKARAMQKRCYGSKIISSWMLTLLNCTMNGARKTPSSPS